MVKDLEQVRKKKTSQLYVKNADLRVDHSQRRLDTKGRKPKAFGETEGLWAVLRVHLKLKITNLWSLKVC